MTLPKYPLGLLQVQAPTQARLRAVLDKIHEEPQNRHLWCEAVELNAELVRIEREFFNRKETAA